MPLLLLVNVLMLGVLRATDRMPAAGFGTYTSLTVTLLLDAAVGLGLGLLASAAVTDPTQATLVLPMLCFPAVLFSGAILPVPLMTKVGDVLSYPISTRWAFEALGRDLGAPTTCSAKAARRSGRRSSRSTATASRTPSGSTGRSWAGSRPSAWLRRARCSPPSAGPPASRRYRFDAIPARKALPMTVGVRRSRGSGAGRPRRTDRSGSARRRHLHRVPGPLDHAEYVPFPLLGVDEREHAAGVGGRSRITVPLAELAEDHRHPLCDRLELIVEERVASFPCTKS